MLYVKEGYRQNSRDSEGWATLKTTEEDVPEVAQQVVLKGFIVFLSFYFLCSGGRALSLNGRCTTARVSEAGAHFLPMYALHEI